MVLSMKITKITLTNAKSYIKRNIQKPIQNMITKKGRVNSDISNVGNKQQVLNKLKNIGQKLKKELWDLVDGLV